MTRDPICGMTVNPDSALHSERDGQTHYFCSDGPTISTRAVTLDFDYAQFGKTAPTTGYEKLLYDCLVGDATLFHRADMVEAAWKVTDPILSTWACQPRESLPLYAPGTWGPSEAEQQHRWQSR